MTRSLFGTVILFVVASMLASLLTEEASAGPFGRCRAGSPQACQSQIVEVPSCSACDSCQSTRDFATPIRTGVAAAAQEVGHGLAQRKAQQQAREGRMRHVGGSLGPGGYEGVGFSTRSAEEAIHKCCYWGQRTPVDIGVARGANGWYATVLYR